MGLPDRVLAFETNPENMTKDDIKQVVLDIIADIAPDEDLTTVKPEVRLRDQLSLDSMDFLDIVMELRKKHGIEVPEADYVQLASLDSCANYLLPKFQAKGFVMGNKLTSADDLTHPYSDWNAFIAICGRVSAEGRATTAKEVARLISK